MTTHTILIDRHLFSKVAAHYHDFVLDKIPYSEFRAKKNGTTITLYSSGKLLLQGSRCQDELNDLYPLIGQSQSTSNSTPTKTTTKPVSKTNKTSAQHDLPTDFATWTLIGSDEVGNGSYFGSFIVCAVYLPTELQAKVKALGVKDSKSLTDTQIMRIATTLKTLIPYHITNCTPNKYNEANQTRNANAIKVSLHNFTIQKLIAKLTPTEHEQLQGVFIDQFTSRQHYMNYLKHEKMPYTKALYMAQKGESIHLACACASIIARAAFLDSLNTLGEPFGITLPSGAGEHVDNVAAKLVRQYGETILDQLTKKHFANTAKVMKLIQK